MTRCGKVCACLLSLLVCAVLLGCQSATPAARIEANPVLFRSLTPEQQLMVQQGKICKGMSKDAVMLAWGLPYTEPVQGEKDGHRYERWVYMRTRTVPVDTIGGMYGGPWRHRYWGGASYITISEPRATVTFEGNVVTEWESGLPSQ